MKKSLLLVVLVVVLMLTLTACSSVDNPAEPGAAGDSAASGSKRTEVKAGDYVAVDYTGKLEDGTEFDSSAGKQPLAFEVGAGQMIPGFDNGVQGMKLGESKTITIPPEQAYGAEGSGPIPPNATLIFDVTVVKLWLPVH